MKLTSSVLMLAIIACVLLPRSAYANWAFSTNENAFDETQSMHVALTANLQGYALGLRCKGSEPSLVLITPEKVSSEDETNIQYINAASPKLLLRVDKNEIHKLDVDFNVVDGSFSGLADDSDELLEFFEEAKNAKTRISAAFEVLGKNMHASNFSVRGSTKNIALLQKACEGE